MGPRTLSSDSPLTPRRSLVFYIIKLSKMIKTRFSQIPVEQPPGPLDITHPLALGRPKSSLTPIVSFHLPNSSACYLVNLINFTALLCLSRTTSSFAISNPQKILGRSRSGSIPLSFGIVKIYVSSDSRTKPVYMGSV